MRGARVTQKGHGRLVVRQARATEILQGYSRFPGLCQVIEVRRKVTDLKDGTITREMEYGVTSLPSETANAKKFMLLMQRHWGIENKENHVRDDSWREDRQVWRRGNGAYTMHVLLSVALNLLRAASPHWPQGAPMTERAEIFDELTRNPHVLLKRVS